MIFLRKNLYLPSRIFLVCFVFLSSYLLVACHNSPSQVPIHQPKLIHSINTQDAIDSAITGAFQNAIEDREDILAFLIYDVSIDHIERSTDDRTAIIWLALIDPQSDLPISTETGISVAHNPNGNIELSSDWAIVLPADAAWATAINSLPDTLLDAESRDFYSQQAQPVAHTRQVFDGYRLPWAPGEAKYLTSSVGHVYIYKTCPSTCLYAFDFADGGMWPILAARGGKVKAAVWQYPNGNTKHPNYIVLEDDTTNPTSYQVYYHLAQDSIPLELRTPGTQVVQGQKIGVVDDTGFSTGHHLHFHVHTNPELLWANSVDITFDDVQINDGRPRTCYESKAFPALGKECQKNNLFSSGNLDREYPTGGIRYPEDDTLIQTPNFQVNAFSEDDTEIGSVQLLLNYSGEWLSIGDLQTDPSPVIVLDLCENTVPDGEFFISLKIIDKAGKQAEGLPGLKRLVKDFQCPLPPPNCAATENEIAFFEQAEYQGNCHVFGIGTYNQSHLSGVDLTQINSIQIGEKIYSIITAGSEIIPVLDSLSELDQIYKIFEIQKIEVLQKPPAPEPPIINVVLPLSGNGSLTYQDQIHLSWETVDYPLEYRAELIDEKGSRLTLDWSIQDFWDVNSLPAGKYQLIVDARNVMGSAQSEINFIVEKADTAPITRLLPIEESSDSTAVLLAWGILDGADDIERIELRYRMDSGEWQAFEQEFPSQLQQTQFFGTPGHTYEFQIRGIDVAGNMEQFHSDTGSTTIFAGTCEPDIYDADGNSDNTSQLATILKENQPQTHNFCPFQDEDWFVFIAEERKTYTLTASVPVSPSQSDPIIEIMSDLENIPIAQAKTGLSKSITKLTWSAPADGKYNIRIYPSDSNISGTNAVFTLELREIIQVNTPSILLPTFLIPAFWILVRILLKIKSFLIIRDTHGIK